MNVQKVLYGNAKIEVLGFPKPSQDGSTKFPRDIEKTAVARVWDIAGFVKLLWLESRALRQSRTEALTHALLLRDPTSPNARREFTSVERMLTGVYVHLGVLTCANEC